MYSNIFYFDRINKIGGVETFFYEIAKKYCNNDITILYSFGDLKQIQRLKKLVRVIKYTGQKIKCKNAFFNYSLKPIDNIQAEKYYEIIHANYKELGIYPNINVKINEYIGVSQDVCNAFTELTGLPCTLCYNPITVEKPKKVLYLLSATRLTREKGKDRILKLAKALDDAEIPYIWTIFTNDTKEIKHPRIIFMEPQLNIRDYIAKSDYVVQLSDTEAYCYTMIESLLLKVPVIVTPWPVLKELNINDDCGFILPFNMDNIPVKAIYEKDFNIKYHPPKDIWDSFIEKSYSTYQEELNSKYVVEALNTYQQRNFKDAQLGFIPSPGSRWTVTKERLDLLLGENENQESYVKLIKQIPKEQECDI